MSRRRYISTEMGRDKRLCSLSDFAALLYTWMLPHAEDCGSLKYDDPEELGWTVIPGRKWTPQKIQNAINEMVDRELVILAEGRLFYPYESFYKHQTYIQAAKRRVSDPNAAKRRKTPQNAASPSPSPSPSKHLSSELDVFETFWKQYPRKEDKGHAKKAWDKAIKVAPAETIIAGLERNLPTLLKTERRFIPLGATWLNGERWTDEPEPRPGEKPPPDLNAKRQRIANAIANLEGGMEADLVRGMVNADEWLEVVGA